MPKLSLSIEKSKQVISDWDRMKAKVENYQLTGGKILFQNLFEVCPEAKPLFGFAITINPSNTNLLKSKRFTKHAKFLMKMVDKTVETLVAETTSDSDDETGRGKRLSDVLTDLGRKHVAYGVKPEFFPFMTQSLLKMLNELIGDPNEDAWNDVFDFLVNGMTSGYNRISKSETAARDKGVVTGLWDRFHKVPQYKEVGGRMLFQHLFKSIPEVKALFGFPLDIDPDSEELLQSKRFAIHSSFLIEMIEKTIDMLGYDDETLFAAMTALGQKHVSFGVQPEWFPYMTTALIHVFKQMLPDFTKDEEIAFEHVMAVLIADLIRGQRTVNKDLAAAKKDIVTASWEKFSSIPDYEKTGGVRLFQHLFEICPDAKLLFGFPKDIDHNSDVLLKNERFLKHATFLLSMIGQTVGLLGMDDDELTAKLLDIGRRHMAYGVNPDYFPFMTKALVKTMTEMLGSEYTDDDKQAWEDILSVFIADMIRGERMMDMGLAAANRKVTAKNWAKLSEIPDYDEVAGMVVFVNLFKVCPESKPLFGFTLDFPEEEYRYSKRLIVHASFIVEMIEKALTMLGKDDKELALFMEDLGKKHIMYKVTPEHLPHMQDSIVHMLKEVLGKDGNFSDGDEEAWNVVLSAIVANMSKAQREIEMKKLAESMAV